MTNQAQEAGNRADKVIKQLANPSDLIVTDKATVDVLDTATPNGNWQARFKGYKASTDKTLHTLRQQAKHFDLISEENERLKAKLEETPPVNEREAMKELFSEEEIDGFSNMVDNKVGNLQSEVKYLQDELSRAQDKERSEDARAAHYNVVDAVSASVPHYAEIDTNPAFATWIKEPDSYGNIRYDMMMRAKNSTPPDVERIVQFYKDFERDIQGQRESPQQYTQQELMQQPKTSQVGGQSSPQQGMGIQWNTATTSQFYKDKALGKISPEDAKALEQDMYRALSHRGA